jgi:EAL domain-containing protein (putative c-di-GMP-specific phosphodiesterase class I)/CheY-like chemotaxis protein
LSTRILVVDDDPLVRRSVERIFDRAGYEVISASSVKEAFQVADNLQMDAALVDYGLAEEDGLQVLSRLRETQPSCLRILMTGRTDFPMVVDAVNRGEVLRVVRKPFEALGLIELLQDAFASARRMAEVATAQQSAMDLQDRAMLDDCLDRHLLRLAVQPIVSPRDGNQVIAFEALLRSTHAVLNGPLPLLRVAERHRRIEDLGREIFQMAAKRLESLPDQAGLFINLHPHQLLDPVLLEQDLGPLLASAGRITVEITERSRLSDIQGWDRSISLLGSLGFSVAIDDLGAGYNSLAMLADLQPRYIKLDVALVRGIDVEPRKQRLVQLMATFADATNAHLIAEGVETKAEADVLMTCGTHYLQGFFFGRPDIEGP